MKTCKFCGKEFEDELVICPECGMQEDAPVLQDTDASTTEVESIPSNEEFSTTGTKDSGKSLEPILSEEDSAADENEDASLEEPENDIDHAEPEPKKRKKKRGLAHTIIGIIFPSVGLNISILSHALILIATVIIAVAFPYLLALAPIAIPISSLCTLLISVAACFLCFIGFLLSVIALVKKNLLGLTGLLFSIFFPALIIIVEIIAIISPYALQLLIQ